MTEQVKLEDVDLETMKADAEKLRKSNEGKAIALRQATGNVVDPGLLAAIKIEVFIDTFLDDNAKVVFAHNFQLRMRQEFDEALKELRKAQLLTPESKLHIAR